MPESLLGAPAYTGMKMYPDHAGGYAIWVPSDWYQLKLKRNHRGFMFSPYPDDINTCVLVEKHKLKFKITPDDLVTLREGFHEGIIALPGVEIESEEEDLTESISMFNARFSFMEGEFKRKRWVRNIYWGNGQLVVIAQGKSPEDFEYWLPMFFNTMLDIQIL